MSGIGFGQSIKSSSKGKNPVSNQLSKTKETPSNQPSESEGMSTPIITGAERISHVEKSENEAVKRPNTDLEKVLKVPYLRSVATFLIKAGCRRVENESEWGEAETAAASNTVIACLLDKAKRMQIYFPEGWDDCKNEVSREDEGSPAYEWEDFDTYILEPVKDADGFEWEEVGVYLSPITAIAAEPTNLEKLAAVLNPAPFTDEKHLQEWVDGSATNPGFPAINLQSSTGVTQSKALLRNPDVNFESGWYTTPRSIYRKGETDTACLLAGSEFKPDNPRQATDEKGTLERHKDGTPKLRKYEQAVALNIGGKKVKIGACFYRVPDFDHYKKTGQWQEDEAYWYRVKDDVQTPIWITEGSKKACSIMSVLEGKYPAIALIGVWGWCIKQNVEEKAAKKPKKLSPELMQIEWKGRTVFICFDSDKRDPTKTVRQAEIALAQALKRLGANVKLIDLGSEAAITRRKTAGGIEEGKAGIDDHRVIINEGFGCDDEFVRLMDESEICKAPKVIDREPSGESGAAAELERLFEGSAAVELFCSTDGEAYATFPLRGLMHTDKIAGEAYRDYLTETVGPTENNPAKRPSLIKGVLNDHAANARRNQNIYPVCVRTALHDGAIYHDLCRSDGRIVRITSEGWEVVPPSKCPVRFVRNSGMLPLPTPEKGGCLADIRAVVNMSDSQLCLSLMWVSFALFPLLSHPIMNLKGAKGRGKTSATRFFTALVDPQKSDCIAMPTKEGDLMLVAASRAVLPIDNLSTISKLQSDTLCQISTGASIQTRKLHTNGEIYTANVIRPIWMNGIPDVVGQSDLLSRTIITELAPILDTEVISEDELNRRIATNKPKIMGLLYDSAVAALAGRSTVKVDKLPRLADFYKWGVCAQTAFGFTDGTFEKEFQAQAKENELAPLESSPLAQALIRWADELRELKKLDWVGLPAELLENLWMRTPGATPRGWPETPKALSSQLARLSEDLPKVGIVIEKMGRTKRGIPLRVTLKEVSE